MNKQTNKNNNEIYTKNKTKQKHKQLCGGEEMFVGRTAPRILSLSLDFYKHYNTNNKEACGMMPTRNIIKLVS